MPENNTQTLLKLSGSESSLKMKIWKSKCVVINCPLGIARLHVVILTVVQQKLSLAFDVTEAVLAQVVIVAL